MDSVQFNGRCGGIHDPLRTRAIVATFCNRRDRSVIPARCDVTRDCDARWCNVQDDAEHGLDPDSFVSKKTR